MSTSIAKAIEQSGGIAAVATLLGESPQTVNNWVSRGVPVPRCAAFEQAVCQRLMRWDLRPDDWHEIWPELIGTKGAPKVKPLKKAA